MSRDSDHTRPNLQRRRLVTAMALAPSMMALSGCLFGGGGSSSDPVVPPSNNPTEPQDPNTPTQPPSPPVDPEPTPGDAFSTTQPSHRGVYEIDLVADDLAGNPYTEARVQIIFTRPNASKVIVDGFYDGNNHFKARAYCDQVGNWSWQCLSNLNSLHQKSGQFEVSASQLPGKLRLHTADNHQFMTDDGQWFLHLGDTGYRYFADTEQHWKAFIDQSAAMGMNKIRVWFNRNRYDMQVLYTADRQQMNLTYWQMIDQRMQYALTQHPQTQLQLIPYSEDLTELNRYANDDAMAKQLGQYIQARYASFPNVHWCISNDRVVYTAGEDTSGLYQHEKDRLVLDTVIDKIANDFHQREPWGTLITNHESRYRGYHFTQKAWSSMALLSDVDQITGEKILNYRKLTNTPVIMEEDRYEVYAKPAHPRDYFRRLMWASLLSGGHATYGGINTFNPFEEGPLNGVQGYQDLAAKQQLEGADDFPHIQQFFTTTKLSLVGMEPNDALAGDSPINFKCCHNSQDYLTYCANPTSTNAQSSQTKTTPAVLNMTLPEGSYEYTWFNPRNGQFTSKETMAGGSIQLTTPAGGDWLLWHHKTA